MRPPFGLAFRETPPNRAGVLRLRPKLQSQSPMAHPPLTMNAWLRYDLIVRLRTPAAL